MYLLNPKSPAELLNVVNSFTFHNVSIKSIKNEFVIAAILFFTFHNVSIKSRTTPANVSSISPLHSTMYLLNPGAATAAVRTVSFTFHNVSIKSYDYAYDYSRPSSFTFHNVSIKSSYVFY